MSRTTLGPDSAHRFVDDDGDRLVPERRGPPPRSLDHGVELLIGQRLERAVDFLETSARGQEVGQHLVCQLLALGLRKAPDLRDERLYPLRCHGAAPPRWGFSYNSTRHGARWLRLGCVWRIDLPRFAKMRSLGYEDLSSTGRPGSLGVRGSNPLSSTISPGPVRARASLRLVPHQCPAADLEILGDVPLAAIPATLLDRRWLLAAAPLAHPTVDDHVAGLIVEYVLEVRVSQSFCSRNDQEQTGRACLRGPHGHLPPPPVRERRPNGFHLVNVTSTITEATTAERASHSSPEHTVGSKDKRLWHRQPERPGGLEINDELEAGRLLDG